MNANNEVLFSEMPGKGGNLGVITLNRPQALNSINQAMVEAMFNQLRIWRNEQTIKAVVIKAAEGRAFCAGGDLRSTYDRFKSHDTVVAEFFRIEYSLNKAIFHFPKPYIALLDGITMGGGVGISIHGSHRVATERLLFAMPETGIGFFPDVGGTYFLPRLPGKTGFYLGLTGARLHAGDSLATGIATQFVPEANLASLVNALAEQAYGNDARASVTAIINQFSAQAKPGSLLAKQPALDAAFSGNTMEEIMLNLKNSTADICQHAYKEILKKSPLSLKVTLRALLDHPKLDFDSCMQQEFRLAFRFLQGHDFVEGIRAVIIDKDQKPDWQPPTLAEVREQDVAGYFAPLERELA